MQGATSMMATMPQEPRRSSCLWKLVIKHTNFNQWGLVQPFSHLNSAIKYSIPTLKIIKEAHASEHVIEWQLATDKEYYSLTKNQMWVLVPRPKGHHVIKGKWVFKIKFQADGSIDCFKVCFVAKGYTQCFGIDFDETFAPVIYIGSLRFILALSAALDLKIKVLDMHTWCKHLSVCLAHLCEACSHRLINICYVPMKNNATNILTKALITAKHKYLVHIVGLLYPSHT